MSSAKTKASEVISLATKSGRVCPQPQEWNRLYDLLPNRCRAGNGWEPALPLILAAWHDAPAMLKMLRLREHIEWAERHNALEKIHAFLVSLPEEKWHHVGE